MAMQKRRRLADPNAQMRRFLNGWRDVLVINSTKPITCTARSVPAKAKSQTSSSGAISSTV